MMACNYTLTPSKPLDMNEGDTDIVNMTLSCQTNSSYTFSLSSTDTVVARIAGDSQLYLQSDGQTVLTNFSVEAVAFGLANIQFQTCPEWGSDSLSIPDYQIIVERQKQTLDLVFLGVLGVIILVYNFSFGCKIRLNLAVKIAKRPIAPAVGFCCQFLIMPPVSITLILL